MVGDNLFGKWLGVLCNWLIIDVLEHQVLVDMTRVWRGLGGLVGTVSFIVSLWWGHDLVFSAWWVKYVLERRARIGVWRRFWAL